MNIEWKISDGPVPYQEALAAMEARVGTMIEEGAAPLVWLLQHPPLYTAGTSANIADLMNPFGFPVYEAGRGGEYTYHGPGQRVAYVMMHVPDQDIRRYVWRLEEWIIRTLAALGVTGERREGRIGIWAEDRGKEAKIAAIGVRVKKWVAYHGIAINVSPDLTHFTGIVPCGIRDYGITSLEKLGVNCTMAELDAALKTSFEEVF